MRSVNDYAELASAVWPVSAPGTGQEVVRPEDPMVSQRCETGSGLAALFLGALLVVFAWGVAMAALWFGLGRGD